MKQLDAPELRPLERPDPQIRSIQPGGGVCMRFELAWGHVRRGWLRHVRPGYVRRMRQKLQGSTDGCPHEVLDPRDLKYFRNVCSAQWDVEDDPFAWRDRLPFARVGLAELLLLGGGSLLAAVAAWWIWWPLTVAVGLVGLAIVWFFRDPPRRVPEGHGLVVAPADGKIVAIQEMDDPFVGGPAWQIGIFLSVFNVHLNRVPMEGRIVGQTYRPGKFLNALRPASARENEQLETRFQQSSAPFHCFRVRQIAGAIARRIVCWAGPGHNLRQGERFGMIKIGSRTELVIPRTDDVELTIRLGQKVQAGSTVVARYRENNLT